MFGIILILPFRNASKSLPNDDSHYLTAGDWSIEKLCIISVTGDDIYVFIKMFLKADILDLAHFPMDFGKTPHFNILLVERSSAQ